MIKPSTPVFFLWNRNLKPLPTSSHLCPWLKHTSAANYSLWDQITDQSLCLKWNCAPKHLCKNSTTKWYLGEKISTWAYFSSCQMFQSSLPNCLSNHAVSHTDTVLLTYWTSPHIKLFVMKSQKFLILMFMLSPSVHTDRNWIPEPRLQTWHQRLCPLWPQREIFLFQKCLLLRALVSTQYCQL